MSVSFMPDLPDPPTYTAYDFTPSVHWPDVKYMVMYKELDGYLRVIACETREEFEEENLAVTFSDKHTLIESWSFVGK